MTPKSLPDAAEISDWAETESSVISQAIAQACALKMVTRAWQIFAYQSVLIGSQGYWADCEALGKLVLAQALEARDYAALGWTHRAIGHYCTSRGSHAEARAHHVDALDCFRRCDDLVGQAYAHHSIAQAASWRGTDIAEGLQHEEKALALFRRLGDVSGEGYSLIGLGDHHASLGNHDQTRSYAQQATDLAPRADRDGYFLADAWNLLGVVHCHLGDYNLAITCHRRALAINEHPSAAKFRAGVLMYIGDAQQAAGDLPAAIANWQRALETLDELAVPDDLGIGDRIHRASLR